MLSAPLIDPRAMSGTAISDSGSGGVPSTNLHARVEVGPVRQHGLAVRDSPAGDALPEAERLVGDHLLGVVAAREDAPEPRGCLVGLVEGEVVVGDELVERVRDPLQ